MFEDSYERREPTLKSSGQVNSTNLYAREALKVGSNDPIIASAQQEHSSDENYANRPKPPYRIASSGGLINSNNDAVSISIMIPTIIYFAAYIILFLKSINLNLPAFYSILVTTDVSNEVLIIETVAGSLIQVFGFFSIVSLILWCGRLAGVGRSKNFRRMAHSICAVVLIIAALVTPRI